MNRPSPSDLDPSEQRLLAALTEVVDERRRSSPSARPLPGPRRVRPHRAGLLAAAGAVAAVTAGVLLPSQQAFAVTSLPDGRVKVTLSESFRDAAALQDRLAQAGVKVRVAGRPGLPCQVGKVLGAGVLPDRIPGNGPDDPLAPSVSGLERTSDGFIVGPDQLADYLYLIIGVEPGPGEAGAYVPDIPGCPPYPQVGPSPSAPPPAVSPSS